MRSKSVHLKKGNAETILRRKCALKKACARKICAQKQGTLKQYCAENVRSKKHALEKYALKPRAYKVFISLRSNKSGLKKLAL